MDFVINPGSRVDPLDGPMQPGAKGKPGGGKPKVRLLLYFVAGACGSITEQDCGLQLWQDRWPWLAVLTPKMCAIVTHTL